MACSCNKKNITLSGQQDVDNKEPTRSKSGPAATEEADAPEVVFQASVRSAGVPLACGRCLEKHLCKALVYSAEAQEEARPIEAGLSQANLSCAAEHARALGDERADAIADLANIIDTRPDEIRKLLTGGGDDAEKAIGYLGIAEDALRFSGNAAAAGRVRDIRVAIQSTETK